MNILIVKLCASGDVVRTTPLLRRLRGHITWLVANKNVVLLDKLLPNLLCVPWEQRSRLAGARYDLVINLEDDSEPAVFLRSVEYAKLFGVYADAQDHLRYTPDSGGWFDLSLISNHGRQEADRRKLCNRRTYQEMVFSGLGLTFDQEPYLLPQPIPTGLAGDVAIASEAGEVWPMKNWHNYPQLKLELERQGLKVNFLPQRASLLQHLGDIQQHRCLVSADSLPMHLALGTRTPCVTLFTCTSPWEIHDYGIQTKVISPLLADYFYKRNYDKRAVSAISLDQVMEAVLNRVETRQPVCV